MPVKIIIPRLLGVCCIANNFNVPRVRGRLLLDNLGYKQINMRLSIGYVIPHGYKNVG